MSWSTLHPAPCMSTSMSLSRQLGIDSVQGTRFKLRCRTCITRPCNGSRETRGSLCPEPQIQTPRSPSAAAVVLYARLRVGSCAIVPRQQTSTSRTNLIPRRLCARHRGARMIRMSIEDRAEVMRRNVVHIIYKQIYKRMYTGGHDSKCRWDNEATMRGWG
ncbi:hypothetical protein OH77DRAFT_285464 [Trametes cingulata]|nr:hypothetical protein OH77DRAFT_285464 [Trametes cingulata]